MRLRWKSFRPGFALLSIAVDNTGEVMVGEAAQGDSSTMRRLHLALKQQRPPLMKIGYCVCCHLAPLTNLKTLISDELLRTQDEHLPLHGNCTSEMQDASLSTSSVKDLVRILYGGKRFGNHVDEVWPNLFLGDMSVANDRYSLWKLGITHVLNAAHGRMYCQGSHDFYGSTVDYYGVPADDSPSFDLSPFFYPSAEYIKNALDEAGARVFVHCAVGVSRSASLVLAFLMIIHHYTLLEAIIKVKERRWVFPNRGFLKQLQALDVKLRRQNGP